MNPLHRLRHPSPAKLFAIGFVGIFAVTILSGLYSVSGGIALDMFRGDDSLFDVGPLSLLVPLLFGLCAVLYALFARVCQRGLNPILVSIHFWTGLAFACFLVYLSRDRIDIPIPDWKEVLRPQLETEALVFVIARIIFVSAELLFVVNLLGSYFFGREIQTHKT
jgi:heme/copper-type cytochrome/quinol oxidase subunit 1